MCNTKTYRIDKKGLKHEFIKYVTRAINFAFFIEELFKSVKKT